MKRIGWVVCVLGALACPWLAAAQEPDAPANPKQEISPNVKVNDHAFSPIKAITSGCQVNFELYFSAPENQYNDPKNLVRNMHRFRARVRMGDHGSDSPTFVNRSAGRRWFRWSVDTTGQGCWAQKKEAKLWKLDVNGCRGEPCRVEPF